MIDQTDKKNRANKMALYRLKNGDAYEDLRLSPYASLIMSGRKACIENYDQIYICNVSIKDIPVSILEKIARHLPDVFEGRSLEVGDVIALRQNAVQSAYYVDNLGGVLVLIALPSFFTTNEDTSQTLSKGVEEHDTPDAGFEAQQAEAPLAPRKAAQKHSSVRKQVAQNQEQMHLEVRAKRPRAASKER